MEQQTKTNLTNPDIWIRLLYMLVFGIALFVARMIIWVIAVLQFILVLVTGDDNVNLRNLGQGVARWSFQAFLFLTFNSEEKPFPFSDWPELEESEVAEEPEVIVAASEDAASADDVPTFTADQAGTIEGEVEEAEEPKSANDESGDEAAEDTPDKNK